MRHANVMDYDNPEFRKERTKDWIHKLRTRLIDLEAGSEEFNDTWELIKLLEMDTGTVAIESYDEGYDEGYDDGKRESYDEGYDDGREEGFDAGYYNGHEDGFTEGIEEGRAENERL